MKVHLVEKERPSQLITEMEKDGATLVKRLPGVDVYCGKGRIFLEFTENPSFYRDMAGIELTEEEFIKISELDENERDFYYPTWVGVPAKMEGLVKEKLSPKTKETIENIESFTRGAVMGYVGGYEAGHLRGGIMCEELKTLSSRYPHTLKGDIEVVKKYYKRLEDVRKFRVIWYYEKARRKFRLTKDYQKGFHFGYKIGRKDGSEMGYLERILP